MTVYVDDLKYKKKNGRIKYCHMIADTLEELHEFCQSVGISKHFFHAYAKHKHYDLNERNRNLAIENGAIEISTREIIRKMNEKSNAV